MHPKLLCEEIDGVFDEPYTPALSSKPKRIKILGNEYFYFGARIFRLNKKSIATIFDFIDIWPPHDYVFTDTYNLSEIEILDISHKDNFIIVYTNNVNLYLDIEKNISYNIQYSRKINGTKCLFQVLIVNIDRIVQNMMNSMKLLINNSVEDEDKRKELTNRHVNYMKRETHNAVSIVDRNKHSNLSLSKPYIKYNDLYLKFKYKRDVIPENIPIFIGNKQIGGPKITKQIIMDTIMNYDRSYGIFLREMNVL